MYIIFEKCIWHGVFQFRLPAFVIYTGQSEAWTCIFGTNFSSSRENSTWAELCSSVLDRPSTSYWERFLLLWNSKIINL